MYKTDMWRVSPYIDAEEVRSQMKLPGKVIISDVTIREGGFAHGFKLTPEEKIEYLKRVDALGIPLVEVPTTNMGVRYPARWKEQAYDIRTYAKLGLRLQFLMLVWTGNWLSEQALKAQVDLAVETGMNNMLFVHNASSYVSFGEPWEKERDRIRKLIEYARGKGVKRVFAHPMDATRGEWGELEKRLRELVDSGANGICLADGGAAIMPTAMRYFVGKVKNAFPGVTY